MRVDAISEHSEGQYARAGRNVSHYALQPLQSALSLHSAFLSRTCGVGAQLRKQVRYFQRETHRLWAYF